MVLAAEVGRFVVYFEPGWLLLNVGGFRPVCPETTVSGQPFPDLRDSMSAEASFLSIHLRGEVTESQRIASGTL